MEMYKNSRIMLAIFSLFLIIFIVFGISYVSCLENKDEIVISETDITSSSDIVSETDVIVLEMNIIPFVETKNIEELEKLISECDKRIVSANTIIEAGKSLGYDENHPVIVLANNEITQASSLKNEYDKIHAEEVFKREIEKQKEEAKRREEEKRKQEETAKKTTTKPTTAPTINTAADGSYLGNFKLTAYCNCSKCCGKWAGGATKSGTMPKQGRTIAVDPSIIPLGTKVRINGHVYTAEDTGSAIKGKKIDVYFDSHQAAINFGVQYADVYRA